MSWVYPCCALPAPDPQKTRTRTHRYGFPTDNFTGIEDVGKRHHVGVFSCSVDLGLVIRVRGGWKKPSAT